MKFLTVFCKARGANVFINLDKIVLLQKLNDETTLIELDGHRSEIVNVAMPAEELMRKINGEDRAGIGFRAGQH